ncbi:MAG: alkaline phosphatase family protein, partial [Pedobacter sp.]|nr:alkaline phosphatase family protein [Chitinophagaceae bacterium]
MATLFVANTMQAQSKTDTTTIHTLVVFFDGLRPDYITPEAMPNVYAFSKRGCYAMQHHSVFPTVTRVNASSYATGSYPATHGLMGNTVYFPQVDKKKGLNTGEASELNKVSVATNGHLLTAISLGEILAQAGQKMMVFSSGSTGSTLLQNHTLSGGATINPDMVLPPSFTTELVKEIGPIPANTKTKTAQNVWVTDAIIKYALRLDGPLVSSIWFTEPDHTAHADGIGSATAMASIKVADEQFGRLITELEKRGLTNNFNIIISADHGFVTHIGNTSVAEFLIKEGLKKDKESEDVVVAEGAIYVQ